LEEPTPEYFLGNSPKRGKKRETRQGWKKRRGGVKSKPSIASRISKKEIGIILKEFLPRPKREPGSVCRAKKKDEFRGCLKDQRRGSQQEVALWIVKKNCVERTGLLVKRPR